MGQRIRGSRRCEHSGCDSLRGRRPLSARNGLIRFSDRNCPAFQWRTELRDRSRLAGQPVGRQLQQLSRKGGPQAREGHVAGEATRCDCEVKPTAVLVGRFG